MKTPKWIGTLPITIHILIIRTRNQDIGLKLQESYKKSIYKEILFNIDTFNIPQVILDTISNPILKEVLFKTLPGREKTNLEVLKLLFQEYEV